MENRAYAILTGLFTLLLGAALVIAVIWFRGDARDLERYVLVSRYSVNGLYPQSEVRFRGINVGKVERLQVDPGDLRNILVFVRVDGTLPITRGSYGQLGYQGVTGLAYVMLDDDGSNPQRLTTSADDPARIPMRPNVFDDLASAGQVLLHQANDLLERLNSIASAENEQRLASTLKNFEAASRQLEPALRTIPRVAERLDRVLDEENTERIRRTLANLETASGAIAPVAEDSRRILSNLQTMTQRLDQLSGELSSEVTQGTLPRINQLVEQLTQDSRDLHRVLLQVERDPRSLLFGKTPGAPGPGEPGFSKGDRK
jgi:phospholipid/cholesterol/gamma-HCH transport system substrate-binding protein